MNFSKYSSFPFPQDKRWNDEHITGATRSFSIFNGDITHVALSDLAAAANDFNAIVDAYYYGGFI